MSIVYRQTYPYMQHTLKTNTPLNKHTLKQAHPYRCLLSIDKHTLVGDRIQCEPFRLKEREREIDTHTLIGDLIEGEPFRLLALHRQIRK